MGRAGKPVRFLRQDEIVEINRRMILRYGGFFAEGDDNLANPGALDYVLTAIRGSFFGHVPYPSLLEKAAALAWHMTGLSLGLKVESKDPKYTAQLRQSSRKLPVPFSWKPSPPPRRGHSPLAQPVWFSL